MEQKEWEQRLDRVADRVAESVKEGVNVMEDAFNKGRDQVKSELGTKTGDPTAPAQPAKGTPRLGLMLVGLGIVWLLHSLGILDQPVFPILLIILGVYFIVRSKN